jgi:hypothetical protein
VAGAIRVEGLSELQRATSRLSREFGKGVREALEAAGEPIRSEASELAHSDISGMRRARLPWWRMRIGVTRSTVYVAPEQRGNKKRTRPTPRGQAESFKREMIGKAMNPAVDHHIGEFPSQVNAELDDLFKAWGRLG